MKEDIFKGLGVEITLADPDDFLKVKETLTRIGIASKKENKLYQSCLILHKQGRYSVLNFKEMFILDGKTSDISEDDIFRRNRIVSLLDDWGLLTINDPEKIEEKLAPMSQIKIIPYKEKSDWELISKYNIGKKG